MSVSTRTENSKRNILYGLSCQVLGLLFSFVNRQIFIELLGKEYLGINGLFANVLTLLSLTEMGLGNTYLFILYKPIHDQDYARLRELLGFCKKMFYCVAFGVFTLGILIVPLLPLIVDVDMEFKKIAVYYFIYLMNSVLSYFSASKSLIIDACQKNYVTNLYRTVCKMIQNVCQIAFLLFFHDYLTYLLIEIGCTILYNISITDKARKMYPYIFKEKGGILGREDRRNIWEMMRSTFVYKIGGTIVNYTDDLLISIIITTVTVGYYSNYKMVEGVVSQLIGVITKAITASLGDLNAEDGKERSLKTFRMLVFAFHVLTTFCGICMLLCLNHFIFLWIGESYVLEMRVVFAIVFCFYISHIITPVWVYRETMGMYQETKYLMLAAAFINLILSVILGNLTGLSGIIAATGLARLFTTVWYEPRILFSKKFDENVNSYYAQQAKYASQAILCVILAYFTTQNIPITLAGIIGRVAVVLLIVLSVFILFNRKTAEYVYTKEVVKAIVGRYG